MERWNIARWKAMEHLKVRTELFVLLLLWNHLQIFLFTQKLFLEKIVPAECQWWISLHKKTLRTFSEHPGDSGADHDTSIKLFVEIIVLSPWPRFYLIFFLKYSFMEIMIQQQYKQQAKQQMLL